MKPSREVKPGDEISIEQDIAVRQARVLDFPAQRVAAREVDRFREDLTPKAQPRTRFDFLDDSGDAPRPNKKQRRILRALLDKD